jgi:hypothetical protein
LCTRWIDNATSTRHITQRPATAKGRVFIARRTKEQERRERSASGRRRSSRPGSSQKARPSMEHSPPMTQSKGAGGENLGELVLCPGHAVGLAGEARA